MNWTRQQLKSDAKFALLQNYWPAVLVGVIVTMCVAVSNGPATSQTTETVVNQAPISVQIGTAAGVAGLGFLALAFRIFVHGPLEVGCRRFFYDDLTMPADLNALKTGFSGNYMNVVLVMFLRNLFITLWTLLLIVPGIIKAYEYRMVPYLLGEDPDMPYKEALAVSKEMMYGEKMNAFVLDLSFLGWTLLTICTCGLVGIFWQIPYESLADAGLYRALRPKSGFTDDFDQYGQSGYNFDPMTGEPLR